MKHTIFVTTTYTEFENYFGEESSYTRTIYVTEFDVEFENVIDLNRYITFLNLRNVGLTYSLNKDGECIDKVYLDSNSFMLGFDDYSKSVEIEKKRLSDNREIRKEIKRLKEEKSKMNRSEIIKSKINSRLSELKNSIK